MHIQDIKIGNQSIVHFLEFPEQDEASGLERILGMDHEITLALSEEHSQKELHSIFLEEYTDELRVELADKKPIWLKNYIPKSKFRKSIIIPVEIDRTPCDDITHIIYREVNEYTKGHLERSGSTTKIFSLDDIFRLLLKDKINLFLDKLSPTARNHQCFKDFVLLKWLQGREAHGFIREEYRIHAGIRNLLNPVVKAIQQAKSSWEYYDFSIRCIGYTDPVPVSGIKLDHRMTGVQKWTASMPFNPHYEGCRGDNLTQRKPTYINYGSQDGINIDYIQSNCELGAARAYVVATYLLLELELDRASLSYATGGVSAEHSDDELNRRVSIEVILKAARE